jgi:DNA-binding transcriptional MerR regulator
MAEHGYRVPEVCGIVGITYRQLDYWARTGLVRPSVKDAKGSGSQRLYSFQDLALLKLIKRMLDSGVNLQQVRKAMKTLKGLDEPALGATLVVDGNRIYSVESPEAVVDLVKGGQAVFAIALDKVWTDLEGSLARATRKGRSVRAAGGE